MSTVRATNFQHASATNPAIVLAADGSATANVSAINNGPLAGFRNAIINGNFDIWQRGTSQAADAYGSDRWRNTISGTSCTQSRQSFTLGQTEVPGEPTYFCRNVVSSSAGAGNFARLMQNIEDVRTFAGQQITVSFWAKADASKSIAIDFGQFFGSGGSPSSFVSGIGAVKKNLTTSWQKITHTITLTSIASKTLGSNQDQYVQFSIWFDAGSSFNARTDTLGQQSGTFDIAQVQLEAGPVATPFERRPIGAELSLCQRYCQKGRVTVSTGSSNFPSWVLPVVMRVTPTIAGSYSGGSGSTFSLNVTDFYQQTGHTTWAELYYTLSAEL